MKKSGCSAAKYTCDPKKPRNNKGKIGYKATHRVEPNVSRRGLEETCKPK
jgi:hypothetical protein